VLTKILNYETKEYPAGVRTEPQQVFETPNSNNALMIVLREGVRMALGDDYTIVDDYHISFVAEVPETLNVFILTLKAGASGVSSIPSTEYVYTQSTESTTWLVEHNLGNQYPSVTVVDDLDNILSPTNIQYQDLNSCVVTFGTATKGRCICRL